MLNYLRHIFRLLRGLYNVKHEQDAMSCWCYDEERTKAEIIRHVHSIEKGLSLQNIKQEFGTEKIDKLFRLIEHYCTCQYDIYHPCIFMAVDALTEYLKYHDSIGCSSVRIKEIERNLDSINARIPSHDGKYGGVLTFAPNVCEEDIATLKKLLLGRHSIRAYTDDQIETDAIIEAIELANHCPSACNRQTTRVYILEKSSITEEFQATLSGVGGFAEQANKFILITGVMSAFQNGEESQSIVNAGIFAGYLSLILHAYGIGSCVIQRRLWYTRAWGTISKIMDIPPNQQPVCLMSIGKAVPGCRVPVSYRVDATRIVSIRN